MYAPTWGRAPLEADASGAAVGAGTWYAKVNGTARQGERGKHGHRAHVNPHRKNETKDV